MSLRTMEERRASGKQAREQAPRRSHADWSPSPDRRDPVELLVEQNATRVPWLVPVRHARMQVSPFTFYRGTARIMAADLAGTPTSGLLVQLGGDAHLSNFGAYASPERALVVDANDFDETLPGPWEWDLKRLAASFMVASRHLGFSKWRARSITASVTHSYRQSMAEFADTGFLDLWYEYTTVHELPEVVGTHKRTDLRRLMKFEAKARTRNNLQALSKLAEGVDGRSRLRVDRPILVPIREVLPEFSPDEIEDAVRTAFQDYLGTVRPDRRKLLERYEIVDIGLKVVGVGSVGTRCYVILLEGRDEHDPLLLQAKEANASVLEEFLEPSEYPHHGERVVVGQRMIQSESDIFLGWSTGQRGVEYYLRQLRDWKGSYDVETASPRSLGHYARICGHIMARGHARTGDPAAISAYMGPSTKLDDVLVEFSEKYADQTERDYKTFTAAIAEGRLQVSDEI